MIRIIAGAVAALVTFAAADAQERARRLPDRLAAYVTEDVRLSAPERQRLAAGQPVTKLLDGDESQEVGIFGAVWIDAPIARYVEAVKDIERLERGRGFTVTKRISSPPRLDDFAALTLPEEDIDALRTCRVGDCDVKLSADGLRRFRTEIDWRRRDAAAAANALMRRLAYERVVAYLDGGNERLAVYRDDPLPTSVAQELRAIVDAMPELSGDTPSLRRYLLEYPRATLTDATSFLYWQITEFGLKPTIRISHVTIREGPDDTVVTSKMLYASHYFRAALELRVLVPEPERGPGFWFVTVNRSRSDGLSGFTGLFVRPGVRRGVQSGTLTVLRTTKQRLERRSP